MASTLTADVLSLIMLLTDPLEVRRKFTFATVSRHWRATALSSRSLWATFTLRYPRSYEVLPLLLDRSGNNPLYIKLHCGIERQHALAIESHLGRLRDFEMHCNAQDFFPGFLTNGQTLPILDRLSLVIDDGDSDAQLNLVAPVLRELVLRSLPLPTSWNKTIFPSAVEVQIHSDGPACIEVLHRCLMACPQVRDLVLVELETGPEEGKDDDYVNLRRILQERPGHLEELTLWGYADHAARLLAVFNAVQRMPRSTSIYFDDREDASFPAAQQLLHGLDPVVEVWANEGNFHDFEVWLRTAAGLERGLASELYHWLRLFPALPLSTVRRVSLCTEAWKVMLGNTCVWPALELLTLRGSIHCKPSHDQRFVCAALAKLLITMRTPKYYDMQSMHSSGVQQAVMGIVTRIERRAQGAAPTVVCLGATRLAVLDADHVTAREELRGSMRVHEEGSWELCTDCCRKACPA